jgi:hypothetical protein
MHSVTSRCKRSIVSSLIIEALAEIAFEYSS